MTDQFSVVGSVRHVRESYEDRKIAIFCDGFAFHGTSEKLSSDAMKRNFLQTQGWSVLTFWGTAILKHPGRCIDQIARTIETTSRAAD